MTATVTAVLTHLDARGTVRLVNFRTAQEEAWNGQIGSPMSADGDSLKF